MSLFSIIPDYKTLLELEPEEMAGVLLEYINSDKQGGLQLHYNNFCSGNTVKDYPRDHWDELIKALAEGWRWLEREGLLAPIPGDHSRFTYITKRGLKVRNRDGLKSYRAANLLPREILHPLISIKVRPAFIRGEYDTAIFQSFKEVEVAVRSKAGYGDDEYGVNLMKKAFNVKNGLLTDYSAVKAERESMMFLFAGAIGLYKNPRSHRAVDMNDASEAVETIMFASRLLKIVEGIKVNK